MATGGIMAKASKIEAIKFGPYGSIDYQTFFRDEYAVNLRLEFEGRLKAGQDVEIKIGDVAIDLGAAHIADDFQWKVGEATIFNWGTYVDVRIHGSDTLDTILATDTAKVTAKLLDEGKVVDAARQPYFVYPGDPVSEVGDHVPLTYALADQSGERSEILSGDELRPALIEIGGLWCAPSLRLARDNAEYAGGVWEDFDVKTLLKADYDHETAQVSDADLFAQQYQLSHPVYTGGSIGELFYTTSIPFFLVVDQVTGEVLATFKGVVDGKGAVEDAYDALARIEAEGDTPGLALTGTAGDDRLYGSARGDTLRGGGGYDRLLGGLGNDRLEGNRGGDILNGGRGDDVLDGGGGNDVFLPGLGSNRILGGAGDDSVSYRDFGTGLTVTAHTGDQIVVEHADGSKDEISSVETFIATDSADRAIVLGGTAYDFAGGDDMLWIRGTRAEVGAGGGDDAIRIAGRRSVVDGDSGDDRIVVRNTLNIARDGSGDDTIIVTGNKNLIEADGGGKDRFVIAGETNMISLFGNLFGNPAEMTDKIIVKGDETKIVEGNMNDIVVLGDASGTLIARSPWFKTDSLVLAFARTDGAVRFADDGTSWTTDDGGSGRLKTGVSEIRGTAFDDRLVDGFARHATRLDGGEGADRMTGSAASNTFVVDNASDKVIEKEAAPDAVDTVESSIDYTLGDNLENLRLTGAALRGTGNGEDNKIAGTGRDNILTGGGGDDMLNGRGGNDVLDGQAGRDTYVFEGGKLDAETNVDTLHFRSNDTIALSDSLFDIAVAEGETGLGGAFRDLSTGAVDADDRILFDAETGELFYDADGSGGADAILFATLAAGSDMVTADSFILI